MKIQIGDKPSKYGMYVVYEDTNMFYARKVLLSYVNNKWSYPSSDQLFRGNIIGYTGPLPSPKVVDLVSAYDKKFAVAKLIDNDMFGLINGPFTSVKELIRNAMGYNGYYIVELFENEDPKPIGKWSEKKYKWIKFKKKIKS